MVAEELIRPLSPICHLPDLTKKVYGLFLPENFCQKGILPDTQFHHSPAPVSQRLFQPLPESVQILRLNLRIIICQFDQILVIFMQQPVTVQHQEQNHQQNPNEYDLGHPSYSIGIGAQPFSRIHAEQIPSVQPHRLNEERIGLSFIIERCRNSFLPFHSFLHFISRALRQIRAVKNGLRSLFNDSFGRLCQEISLLIQKMDIPSAAKHGIAGKNIRKNFYMVTGRQGSDDFPIRIDRHAVD